MTIIDTALSALVSRLPALSVPATAIKDLEPMLKAAVDDLDDDMRASMQKMPELTSPFALSIMSMVQAGNYPRRGTWEMECAYNTIPPMRTVVGRVAQGVSRVPLKVYRMKRGGPKRTARDFGDDLTVRKAALDVALTAGEIEEVPLHPCAKLLKRWNPEQSGLAARKMAQVHYELTGNVFIIAERINGDGDPYELWPMPPHTVTLPTDPTDPSSPFVVQYRAARVEIARANMIYLRDFDVSDPLSRGVGIGSAFADEFDTDEFAGKFVKAWFANHGVPSWLVALRDKEPAEVARFAADFRQRNNAVGRNGRIHFHNGDFSATRLDDSFKDTNVVELREALGDMVRLGWHVPPEAIGNVQNSNKATALAAQRQVAEAVEIPRLDVWVAELEAQLLPMFSDGDQLFLGYDDPRPVDVEERREIAKIQVGAISVNEQRQLGGWAPSKALEGLHVIDNRMLRFDESTGAPREYAPIAELTTGIERLLAAGDVEGANAMRAELGQRLGVGISPLVLEMEEEDAEEAEVEDVEANDEAQQQEKRVRRWKATGRLVAKGLSTASIDAIVKACDPDDLTDEVMPVERECVDANGKMMAAMLPKPESKKDATAPAPTVVPTYDANSEQVAQYLSRVAAKRVKGVSMTTKRRLRETLLTAEADGLSIDETADRIRALFRSFKGGRADNIAQTEMGASGNFGRLSALVQSGVSTKRWHTNLDGREREAHRAMHGQEQPTGRAFVAPSGAKAMHPGAFSSAALTCRCRCTVVAGLFADDVAQEQAIAFERENAAWEEKMRAATVRGLDKQESAILAKLSQYR